MKALSFSCLLILLLAGLSFAQHIEIPDSAFLYALIEEGVDTNEDSLISNEEAELITILDISFRDISDLAGINAFHKLDMLDCSYNQLTSLDVSDNMSLQYLDCCHNQLTRLDVSNDTTLTTLVCNDNFLTSLDVSTCNALKSLDCESNRLKSLEISNCPDLEYLDCSHNLLTSLEFSNNILLRELECGYNDLTTLILLNNHSLVYLDCIYNQLTSLDFSNCPDLEYLNCFKNQLTILDLSKNPSLAFLYCSNNLLKYLDISNSTALEVIELNDIPTLNFVCAWTSPFPPPGVDLISIGSPNITYTTECWRINGIPDIHINTDSIYMFEIGDLERTGAADLMIGDLKSMNLDELKDSIDWSSSDSPVKNQALPACGACWAFAATALIENLANLSDLSEQAIISCADSGDCRGGWTGMALKYFHEKGVPHENCYPYSGENGDCSDKCTDPSFVVKVTDYDYFPQWFDPNPNTVNDLKSLLQTGPVIVSMDLPSEYSLIDFYIYTGGIYNYDGSYLLNPYGHAVLVVGYNDDKQYFKVKNSWGENWGENGYFRIAYDDVTDDINFGGYAYTASGIYTKREGDEFILSNIGGGTLEISNIVSDKSWLSFNPSTPHSLSFPSPESVTIDCVVDWNIIPCPSDTAIVTVYSNDQDEPAIELTVSVTPTNTQIPDIAVIKGPVKVKQGTTVNYTVSDANVTSFSWSVPPGWIINSGNGTSSISVTVGKTSGPISVTPSNNCGENESSFFYVNVIPTNISSNVIADEIHIYPNPAQNIVYLEIPENIQATKIELFEFTGRILRTFNNLHNKSVSINCEDLSSGIYFIRIHSDDIYTKKLIID